MKKLPLEKLGAREFSPGVVSFGLFMPWVSAVQGNRLWVKVIHEKDQFLQDIEPLLFELSHASDPEYGDYWSADVDIANTAKPHKSSAWGSKGRYVYRYYLDNPGSSGPIDWIVDPFAREFGVGKLSAFTLGYEQYQWSENEKNWKTPLLDDLVMYELMINEFGGDIENTIAKLDYLADLGINCVEVMPVSNVANVVDWGFLPIGYFGVDERFGKRRDFQRFVDEAHKRGIAVIIDAVYGHTSDHFPYYYLYKEMNYDENPFMGPFAKDYFGKSTDFNRALTQDYFYTVNHHWIDCYHVDGFRYDCVPNYWDGAVGQGYANLTYQTYQEIKGKMNNPGYFQRFFSNGSINIIQCAEQLEGPVEVLEQTYSNCTWQDETFGSATGTAHANKNDMVNLGFRLGLFGYPEERTVNGDEIHKTALQYIENHDHERFLCNFGVLSRDNYLLREGDRGLWYKNQPYLIGLLTAKGIPMLWQGQEFGENYFIPDQGYGRVLLFRPVRWDYFYDSAGKSTINLIRKLARLRKEHTQFRHGQYYFYNHYDNYISRDVVLFSREHNGSFSLVGLNFGDETQNVPFTFPKSGNYREELHGLHNLEAIRASSESRIEIPGNYGRIWTLEQ